MRQLPIYEDEAELALGFDHRQEGLHHHRVRHSGDRVACPQPVLVEGARTDLSLEHQILRLEVPEGCPCLLLGHLVNPERRDKFRAPRFKVTQIGLVNIPVYQLERVIKPGRRSNMAERRQKFLKPVPIIPSGTDYRSIVG